MFSAKLEITAAGRALLAKCQSSGVTLAFTGVKIGSGELGGADADALTDVIAAVKTCGIESISRSGDEVRVKFVLRNDNTQPYYFRELALMANDPESGEIAYLYANDGANAELIPTAQTTAVEREITIIVKISNVESITATISSAVYASKEELDAHVQDTDIHITSAERAAWNAKVGLEGGKIPSSVLPDLSFVPLSQKAAAGGVATLDASGKVPVAQIPNLDYAKLTNGKLPSSVMPDMGAWTSAVITSADWPAEPGASSYKEIALSGVHEIILQLETQYTKVYGGASATLIAQQDIYGKVRADGEFSGISVPRNLAGPPNTPRALVGASVDFPFYRYLFKTNAYTIEGTIKIAVSGTKLRIYAAAFTDPAGRYAAVTGTIYMRGAI